MKNTGKLLTILAGVFGIGMSVNVAQAETLRLGDFQSTSHVVSLEGTTRWMFAVEQATNGAIKFEHFPAQQAAKSAAQLDAVNNGILDAALLGTLYHSEVLPLNSVIGLPGFYGTAVQGTEALQSMLAEGPLRDELLDAGVMPIFGFVLPPYQVLAKKHLGGVSDWKALDIRTSGSTQAMTARALGSVGISIPGPEVYTAVERGRLDGVLFPLASVPGYNLQEVVSHISTNGSFGGYSFVMVVGRDKFESLPANVQEIMLEKGREVATHVARVQDDSVGSLAAEWKAQGIEVYQFSDAELTELGDAMQPVTADWMERIGGEKAQLVLDSYRALTSKK